MEKNTSNGGVAPNGTLDVKLELDNPAGYTPPEAKTGFLSKLRPRKGAPVKTLSEEVDLPADMVKKPKPISLAQLFRFTTKTEMALNFLGLICAIAGGSAQPLMSLIFSKLVVSFVTFGVTASNPDSPAFASARAQFRATASQDALYLVFIGIGMYVVTHIYMFIWTYTGEASAKRIRERYLQSVLRQDIAYFDTLGAGEVATRISSDTHLIQQGISEKVAITVSYISAFCTGYIIAYVRSWRLALALTSVLPCIILSSRFMTTFVTRYVRTSLNAVAESGSLAEEVISTIRTAKAFGTQRVLSTLYDTHVTRAYKADIKSAATQGIGMGIFFFVFWNAYALAFYYGTTLVLYGLANVGIVVNVFMAIIMGSFSLALMAPELQAISQARGAAAKIFATIDRVPTIDSSSTEGLKPASVEGRITFEDVKFNYPSRPDVRILKGLSLSLEPGKSAALVGASGSGKSTIVSLVERFYDPLTGSVRLDGVDVRELNVTWLRSQIGYVSQEPTLFGTTVRENVAFGLTNTPFEHVSEEEKFVLIKNACVEANADGFITKLPEGYDTHVGQAGLLLSGGQKQRIAIARAIVSNPKILLLDEATSALDTQSEGIVQNALDKASRGRTTITIAHRLSTIKDADQIYVMSDGMVLEQGTHDELLAANGGYAGLVNAQKLRENPDPGKTGDTNGHDFENVAEAKVLMTNEEAEKAAREEMPLQRVGTGRSLASDIMEERRKQGLLPGQKEDKEYGFTYLFKQMGMLNRDALKYYAIGTVFAICSGMVYPSFGIVYGGAIQGFQAAGPDLRQNGNRNALWFFLIALAASFVVALQNAFFGTAAAHLTRKVRSVTFRAVMRQDVTWFDEERHSTGALTASLADNPQKISGLGGVTLGTIVQSATTLIGGAIVGLCFGWKLALVGIACVPVLVSTGFVRLRVVVLKDKQNKRAHEDSARLACEAAGAIRTVASLTREESACNEYSKSLEIPLRNSNRNSIWSTGLYGISQSMSFLIISLVFWYGSQLVSDLEYNTRAFFITLMSVIFGAITAGNVFARVPDMSSAKSGATNTVNLLHSEPEIDSDSTEGRHLADVKGQIAFRDVHFRYPTRPGTRVLRNLNLVVQPGETVAICGASGCGKSTTIQLIERFYDPITGSVTLDGVPITELNVAEYRKNIAIVSQEPTLYAGTVRFNILLGVDKPAEEVSQQELEAACRDANILDFINSLPQGFETPVGNKGTSLSGGQKQRIAIARALIRNPKVLLLDEATSALDSQSERVVQDALDKASRGRTTIAIAHRLSTIQNADRIYYLKDGRVAEVGTHDELLRLRGGYFDMVQLQDLS